MSEADKFFKNLSSASSNAIHTSMPCAVIKYYGGETPPKADIKPLFTGTTGGCLIINKAPVLKHVGALAVGDTVFVCFSECALDNAGSRRHDLTDAVVIGIL